MQFVQLGLIAGLSAVGHLVIPRNRRFGGMSSTRLCQPSISAPRISSNGAVTVWTLMG
jgi:hypothetical protein